MELKDAQRVQWQFDEQHWDLNKDKFTKLRHILLHLTTLLGTVGRYCERQEHGQAGEESALREEVAPDLLIYALQLANLLSIDIENAYSARLERNRRRSESPK